MAHWEQLRAGRRFPSHADYRANLVPFDEASVFIIKVCESELADEVVEAGRSVIQALGRDPVGCKAVEVLPSSTSWAYHFAELSHK